MAAVVDHLTVKALHQHLSYFELNGADPRDKNWTRKATPADWYTARIGKPSEPLQKPPKVLHDLESTVSWGIRQYGRAFALWVESHCKRTGLQREFVSQALYLRCFARLSAEDIKALGTCVDEDEFGEAMAFIRELGDEQAWADEHGWWNEQ
jgi:hypothetical protein